MTTAANSNRPARFTIEDELDALFRLDEEATGEVLLARHAQPSRGAEAATDDPMLSCEGLRQAELLADRLAGHWIESVYTAPERRCLQTARVVADFLSCPLTVVDGLAEIEFDPEEALRGAGSYAERFKRHPRWDSLPGFTASNAFRRRAIFAVESILAEHQARRCLLITHASVINAYVGMLLSVPRDLLFAADHASITTIRHRADMYGLRGLNDTSHLGL